MARLADSVAPLVKIISSAEQSEQFSDLLARLLYSILRRSAERVRTEALPKCVVR